MSYSPARFNATLQCDWCHKLIHPGDRYWDGDEHSGEQIVCAKCGDEAKAEEDATWQ